MDLVEIEREVLINGHWKNFDDLEESLTLPELYELYGAIKDREYREMKVVAAMNGVDIEEDSKEKVKSFEDVKREAEAKRAGFKNADDFALAQIGIEVISS